MYYCHYIYIYTPNGDFQQFLQVLEDLFLRVTVGNHLRVINRNFDVHFKLEQKINSELFQTFGFSSQIFEKTTTLNTLDNIFINFDSFLNFITQVIDVLPLCYMHFDE